MISSQYQPVRPIFALDFSTAGNNGLTVSVDAAGTLTNSAGTLIAATLNTLRSPDYDPATLANLGALFEEAGTNLCLQSENLATTWSKVRCTAGSNVAEAPSGQTTADSIIEDATAANTHDVRQTFTKAASEITYTVSFYAKKEARDWVYIWLHGTSQSNRGQAFFNLSTGAKGVVGTNGTGFASASSTLDEIAEYPGWYRCRLTVTSNTDTALGILCGAATADNSTGFDGVNGQTATYLWGFDLKASAVLTTYVPTTTAAVERTRDTASIALSSIAGWALPMSFKLKGRTGGGAAEETFVCIDDGTHDEQIKIIRDTSNNMKLQTVTSGSPVCDLTLGAVADNTDFVVCVRVAEADYAGSLDGDAIATATTAGSLPTVTTLRYNGQSDGTNAANGHISGERIWNRPLVNAQCVAEAAA